MFAANHLTRKTPSAYADGVYMMAGQNRPSPRKLSQIFMRGQDGMGSVMNRTALLAFFGKPNRPTNQPTNPTNNKQVN